MQRKWLSVRREEFVWPKGQKGNQLMANHFLLPKSNPWMRPIIHSSCGQWNKGLAKKLEIGTRMECPDCAMLPAMEWVLLESTFSWSADIKKLLQPSA